MVDYQSSLKALRGRNVFLAALFLGCVWMSNPSWGQNAEGQKPLTPPPAPTAQPAPAPPQAVKLTGETKLQHLEATMALGGLRRMSFNFTFKPDTPLQDLLPTPPKASSAWWMLDGDDLSRVPEVAFREPLAKSPEALKQTAHMMAKINHLNKQKTDGFMEALLAARLDLAGLPMAMGDACRTVGERNTHFTQALATIRRAKGQENGQLNARILNERLVAQNTIKVEEAFRQAVSARDKAKDVEKKEQPSPALPSPTPPQPAPPPPPVPAGGAQITTVNDLVFTSGLVAVPAAPVDPEKFWSQYRTFCAQEDQANSKLDRTQQEHVTLARIAALMQVLAPDSVAMRKGLVKYLASVSHAEATRALARLAIFSAEEEVRQPAIEALKVRRERDYTEVLLKGLRYPLPAVAKRATEAMTKLERSDLVPELVSFLEEPDPRAPVMKEVNHKTIPVVREVVRINHHRNCVLCHSPAVPGEVPAQVTTAEVPRPDQPLTQPFEGYSNSIPEILVRLDVTYLRQDFSLMQPVADAQPWPEMQRFDFMVRTRTLTDDEKSSFPATKAEGLSPYQRATLAALRELTGRDTSPNPAEWRKLLNLPARATAQ